jgi:hypothetical protein
MGHHSTSVHRLRGLRGPPASVSCRPRERGQPPRPHTNDDEHRLDEPLPRQPTRRARDTTEFESDNDRRAAARRQGLHHPYRSPAYSSLAEGSRRSRPLDGQIPALARGQSWRPPLERPRSRLPTTRSDRKQQRGPNVADTREEQSVGCDRDEGSELTEGTEHHREDHQQDGEPDDATQHRGRRHERWSRP